MYQGKFDSKNKKTESDVYELLAQRNSASPRNAAPVKESAPVPAKKQEKPRKEVPQQQVETVEESPKRKGPRMGSVIFYTFYFMFILLFFVATYFGLQWLQNWLVDYEAAQPTTKSQETFDQLFADPDWSVLYDMAGIEDTEYEGKEEFVSYMEAKTEGKELTFQETSAGISGKKYVVLMEGEKIATFMLEGESKSLTAIPDWQLGAVELFYERTESFLIQLSGNHTASVNGVALDDSFTIQKATTKAESSGLLPIGTSTAKVHTQKIEGLMAVPTVTVTDQSGKEVPVSYDADNKIFVAESAGSVMSEEEKTVALDAIKAYAEYQIKEASRQKVAQYFDSKGEAYKSIMETVLTWTKGNHGYSFANDSVTGYAKYSDTLFSVYATTELTIKLTDGGTQVKPINNTLLFELQNGKWKVIRMSNADISEPVGEVRLTFMNDSTQLDSKFVKNDATELLTPVVSAPEGKVFVGWMTKTVNAEGKVEGNLIFTPDESGYVSISNGYTLEPMTLYAYFENATEEGAE